MLDYYSDICMESKRNAIKPLRVIAAFVVAIGNGISVKRTTTSRITVIILVESITLSLKMLYYWFSYFTLYRYCRSVFTLNMHVLIWVGYSLHFRCRHNIPLGVIYLLADFWLWQLSNSICLNDPDPVGVKEPESEQGKASVAQRQPGGAGSGRCGPARATRGITAPDGQHHGLRRRQLVGTQQHSHAAHTVPATQTPEQTTR